MPVKSRRPADDDFPYYLEVDQLDPERDDTPDPESPRTRGFAELHLHRPNASPEFLPVKSIQEQTTPYAKRNPDAENATVGWEEGPGVLWDFIETVRDEYYEYHLDDRSELPLFVETFREKRSNCKTDEYCEIYVRDGRGGEYTMWNSDELYVETDDDGIVPHSELIQTVLVAFTTAYEDPEEYLDTFGHLRKQVDVEN